MRVRGAARCRSGTGRSRQSGTSRVEIVYSYFVHERGEGGAPVARMRRLRAWDENQVIELEVQVTFMGRAWKSPVT